MDYYLGKKEYEGLALDHAILNAELQFVLNMIPLYSGISHVRNGDYREATISFAGDAALFLAAPLRAFAEAHKFAKTAKGFQMAAVTLEGTIGTVRLGDSAFAFIDGETGKAAGYLGEAFLRLYSIRVTLKPSIPTPKPVPDFVQPPVLSVAEARSLAAPNRGLIFVRENLGDPNQMRLAQRRAFDFESGTTGAFSDAGSRNRAAPALRFNNPKTRGYNFVKFDGVDTLADGTVELIDSKIRLLLIETRRGPYIPPAVSDQLERMSAAIRQNPTFKAVLEFPDEAARSQAASILRRLRITNITTRVR